MQVIACAYQAHTGNQTPNVLVCRHACKRGICSCVIELRALTPRPAITMKGPQVQNTPTIDVCLPRTNMRAASLIMSLHMQHMRHVKGCDACKGIRLMPVHAHRVAPKPCLICAPCTYAQACHAQSYGSRCRLTTTSAVTCAFSQGRGCRVGFELMCPTCSPCLKTHVTLYPRSKRCLGGEAAGGDSNQGVAVSGAAGQPTLSPHHCDRKVLRTPLHEERGDLVTMKLR